VGATQPAHRPAHRPTFLLVPERLVPVPDGELPCGEEDEALLIGQGLSSLLALPHARVEHLHVPANGQLGQGRVVSRFHELGLPARASSYPAEGPNGLATRASATFNRSRWGSESKGAIVSGGEPGLGLSLS
jgi:hypothetical protein